MISLILVSGVPFYHLQNTSDRHTRELLLFGNLLRAVPGQYHDFQGIDTLKLINGRVTIKLTQVLIPWGIFENALSIHINPSRLETEYTTGCEVNSRVIEVVTDGKL